MTEPYTVLILIEFEWYFLITRICIYLSSISQPLYLSTLYMTCNFVSNHCHESDSPEEQTSWCVSLRNVCALHSDNHLQSLTGAVWGAWVLYLCSHQRITGGSPQDSSTSSWSPPSPCWPTWQRRSSSPSLTRLPTLGWRASGAPGQELGPLNLTSHTHILHRAHTHIWRFSTA